MLFPRKDLEDVLFPEAIYFEKGDQRNYLFDLIEALRLSEFKEAGDWRDKFLDKLDNRETRAKAKVILDKLLAAAEQSKTSDEVMTQIRNLVALSTRVNDRVKSNATTSLYKIINKFYVFEDSERYADLVEALISGDPHRTKSSLEKFSNQLLIDDDEKQLSIVIAIQDILTAQRTLNESRLVQGVRDLIYAASNSDTELKETAISNLIKYIKGNQNAREKIGFSYEDIARSRIRYDKVLSSNQAKIVRDGEILGDENLIYIPLQKNAVQQIAIDGNVPEDKLYVVASNPLTGASQVFHLKLEMTAEDLQAIAEAFYGVNNVIVSGGPLSPRNPLVLNFVGDMAERPVPPLMEPVPEPAVKPVPPASDGDKPRVIVKREQRYMRATPLVAELRRHQFVFVQGSTRSPPGPGRLAWKRRYRPLGEAVRPPRQSSRSAGSIRLALPDSPRLTEKSARLFALSTPKK